jgi:hypothetical protein
MLAMLVGDIDNESLRRFNVNRNFGRLCSIRINDNSIYTTHSLVHMDSIRCFLYQCQMHYCTRGFPVLLCF